MNNIFFKIFTVFNHDKVIPNKYINKKMSIILFLLSSYNSVYANVYEKEINFEKLIKNYKKNSYKLMIIENEKDILRTNIFHTKTQYFPSINLLYDHHQLKKGEEQFNDKYKLDNESFAINISTSSSRLRSAYNNIQLMNSSLKITNIKKCLTEVEISLKLLNLYTKIFSVKIKIKYLEKIKSTQKTILNYQEKLFNNGLKTKQDVLFAISQYNLHKNQLKLENEKLANSLIILMELIDIKLDTKTNFLPFENYENYENVDLVDNTIEINFIKANISKLRKELQIELESNLPKTTIYYNVNSYRKEYSSTYPNSSSSDLKFGASVQWNFDSAMNYSKNKSIKFLEIKKMEIEKKRIEKELYRKFLEQKMTINNFITYKKIKENSISNKQNELSAAHSMYSQGLDYKYKIFQAKKGLLNEELELKIKEAEVFKSKKYLFLVDEGNNKCIHH